MNNDLLYNIKTGHCASESVLSLSVMKMRRMWRPSLIAAISDGCSRFPCAWFTALGCFFSEFTIIPANSRIFTSIAILGCPAKSWLSTSARSGSLMLSLGPADCAYLQVYELH